MEQIVWQVILTLAMAVLYALKVIEKRNNRKSKNEPNPPCDKHSERLAILETKVDEMKEDIKRIEEKINRG